MAVRTDGAPFVMGSQRFYSRDEKEQIFEQIVDPSRRGRIKKVLDMNVIPGFREKLVVPRENPVHKQGSESLSSSEVRAQLQEKPNLSPASEKALSTLFPPRDCGNHNFPLS